MEINLKESVSELVGQVTHEAKSRGFRAANELRNASLRILRGQRSGRIYKKPHSRSTYQASAPGEPPAARSAGGLRVSWHPIAESEQEAGAIIVKPAIWTDKKYAPYLEDGTPKMEPRPYRQPIIEQAKPAVTAIYGQPFLNNK